ncbi:phage tail baseplate protein [Sphingobium sp. DN12]|uniref:GTA baseplate fiber-binding domain-containing protein n=1 Tax=Sphingobium sp. DN12 TaxID=3378073 RepID=UPI003DA479C5
MTPAHRGIAYVVFENLLLSDYGNRIPSLTFEVEADAGAVTINSIAGALSEGQMGCVAESQVEGFAATGADLSEAIAPLVEAYGLAQRGALCAGYGWDRRADRADGAARGDGADRRRLAAGQHVAARLVNSLSATLLAEDLELASADSAALAQGRNLCLVGQELIQFGRAVRTGAASCRLEALRRGLRGTEWAMAGQAAGTRFLLIEADRLVDPLAGMEGDIGAAMRLLAISIGDVEPATAEITISGTALVPPAPMHLEGAPDGAGGWRIGWTWRSRAGWRFVAPKAGLRLAVADRGHAMVHDGTAWRDDAVRSEGFYVAGQQIVGARQPAITGPTGGTTVDSESRGAIAAILAALQGHGLISM